MTTIATRNGIIAADSCTNCINAVFPSNLKLWKSKRTGSVFGFSGLEAAAELFKEWYEADEDREKFPDWEDTFTFLEVRKDGSYWTWFSEMVPIKCNVDFMAIGCGAHFALGAMAAGANAKEAVTIASKYDPYTSKPVVTMRTTK